MINLSVRIIKKIIRSVIILTNVFHHSNIHESSIRLKGNYAIEIALFMF